jgi:hypothetical protein
MIKKFNEFVNENLQDDYYTIGEYKFWADKSYDQNRDEAIHYYIIYGDNEGELIIDNSDKGRGESFEQLDYIEWDNETPEDWEEIEEFVNKNLYDIMENVPLI